MDISEQYRPKSIKHLIADYKKNIFKGITFSFDEFFAEVKGMDKDQDNTRTSSEFDDFDK
jgi:hypothetical protein